MTTLVKPMVQLGSSQSDNPNVGERTLNPTSAPQRLLAKSIPSDGITNTRIPPSVFLPNHLADVYQSAQAILDVSGPSMLAAFGLSDIVWQERLRQIVLLSAALHDLGKANQHFQSAVHATAARDDRQPIRHEWISVWIAMQPAVMEWLLPAVDGCENCWMIAMCAIAGHHPKASHSAPTDKCFQETSKSISVLVENPDFCSCLRQTREWFNLETPPQVQGLVYPGMGDRVSIDRFMNMLADLRAQCRVLSRKQNWKSLNAVCKATLIGADVAGSALWEKIDSPAERNEWIKSSLARVPTTFDLNEIVNSRLKGDKPRDFQNKILASKASVTLVEAGCGSGKTVAAYMWAARQHGGRRLWFCYPTTGTASEGFKGYLFGKFNAEGQIRADLFHSRKAYDLQVMLDASSEGATDSTDTAIRVESLKAWDTQIVNCTVDNVLSVLQNLRQGLYAWPALANSAIVFDEVHCYDDILFGNLLSWLENLIGIPVLLMTASLPSARRQAIIEVCESAGRTFEHIPNGPKELECLQRYRQATALPVSSADECIDVVADEVSKTGRVLWISNTVDRTRNVGDIVAQYSVREPVFYHSRFIYSDRVVRHNEVVAGFSDNSKAFFASTSQVAEMSLDLGYATLLVMELAPIPAMIQRLGRLNRRASPDTSPPIICDFLVLEPMRDDRLSSLPYELEELELAKAWLSQLGQQPLSQLDLARHWVALDESVALDPESSRWLQGGLDTPVDSIRESSFGVTVICHRHYELAKSEGTAQYVLPMNRPFHKHWQSHVRPLRGFPVASDEAIDYDVKRGAEWASHNVL
jgi:CRISPR-associated endonuclease/helicase Cas3